MSFSYVNSISSQWWYEINVKKMFYFISVQRWYRIELKVLIIIFSDKDFHVVLLERTKENELSTYDSERKKAIAWENLISVKNGLKRRILVDIDPRKEDRAIRVQFEKCFLCTLYKEEFTLSSIKVVISHACLIWPTSD